MADISGGGGEIYSYKMDYKDISSLGNAASFGNLTIGISVVAATSNS